MSDPGNIEKLEFPIVQNFSPEVPIEVFGVLGGHKVVAIVDSGFTGFLMLPMAVGIRCHLSLWGVQGSTLADGRKVNNLQCVGSIRFGSRTLTGLISLTDTGNECLLGMQFLEQLNGSFQIMSDQNKAVFTFPKVVDPEPSAKPITTKRKASNQ